MPGLLLVGLFNGLSIYANLAQAARRTWLLSKIRYPGGEKFEVLLRVGPYPRQHHLRL